MTLDEEVFNITNELSEFQPPEAQDIEPPSDYDYATSTLAGQQMIDASDHLISGQLLSMQSPSPSIPMPSQSSDKEAGFLNQTKAKLMPNRRWRAPLFLNRNAN